MSVPTIIVGYIEEAFPGWRSGGDPARLARLQEAAVAINNHNETVLEALPQDDAFPPLTRPMFGWAPARAPMITYQNRLVHFAACMKNADFSMRLWLDKFEELLRKMYWESAYLRIKAVYVGTHEFEWRPTKRWIEELCRASLGPITEWDFTSTMDHDQLEGLRRQS